MSETVTPSRPTAAQTNTTESVLIKAQAVAGILFFCFLVLHLSNTLLAAFGADQYNSYQRAIRQIYQQPVLELLLVLGPLTTHAIAAIWLYIIRKPRRGHRPLRYRVQTWSGLFLMLVVFGHVLATRGVSYWYGAFPEFEGVSFSLWWVPGYFYPYYFLLFMAGLYHGSMGATTLLSRAGLVSPRGLRRLPVSVATLGAIGVTFALLGFGGVMFDIDDPRDNNYAKQYAKLLGVDLSQPRR